jgi:Tfp pilus assembly protein PilO
MKIPKNYFSNLNAAKYREYLKLLPSMQQENTRIIATLIFTFFALSFFGIFAINPTLTTIIELRKKLADSQLVYEGLQTKISNLSSLQQQYNTLEPDLLYILEAVPQDPRASLLMAQVMGLAREKGILILSLETSRITLTGEGERAGTFQDPQIEALLPIDSFDATPQTITDEPAAENKKEESFTFTLQAQGSYEDLLDYANSLSRIQRIIKVESMSLNSASESDNLILDLRGKAYYKK